jgi:DNA-binding IclR family transcriptional regulator
VVSSTTVYSVSPKRTKSLERATEVIGYMQAHTGSPVSVSEVADDCKAFYEEVLHILTTLEALGMVVRYSREGAPKEGPRVAYLWRQPTQEELEESRTRY